jgi:hypothetical protein
MKYYKLTLDLQVNGELDKIEVLNSISKDSSVLEEIKENFCTNLKIEEVEKL